MLPRRQASPLISVIARARRFRIVQRVGRRLAPGFRPCAAALTRARRAKSIALACGVMGVRAAGCGKAPAPRARPPIHPRCGLARVTSRCPASLPALALPCVRPLGRGRPFLLEVCCVCCRGVRWLSFGVVVVVGRGRRRVRARCGPACVRGLCCGGGQRGCVRGVGVGCGVVSVGVRRGRCVAVRCALGLLALFGVAGRRGRCSCRGVGVLVGGRAGVAASACPAGCPVGAVRFVGVGRRAGVGGRVLRRWRSVGVAGVVGRGRLVCPVGSAGRRVPGRLVGLCSAGVGVVGRRRSVRAGCCVRAVVGWLAVGAGRSAVLGSLGVLGGWVTPAALFFACAPSLRGRGKNVAPGQANLALTKKQDSSYPRAVEVRTSRR
jgi:hypothetical protein